MDFKFFKILLLFIFIISIPMYCFADDINEYNEVVSLDYDSIYASSTLESEPSINSRAAVVIERSTGTVLYGKDENEKRKMASTTKIMTAIIVLENVEDLSTVVTVSGKAAGTGGSRLGLSKNCKITVRDLLYGLMLCSGNDAAVALAEFVGDDLEGFATLMNNKASQLGLNNTHFITPHGLDNDDHYTTAYELAILTNYALNNDTFKKIVGTSSYTVTINGYQKRLNTTNELLGNLDGIYGVKTGFTNGANRCLVTACKRDNLDIICVVLGADTRKFRSQDSAKLIEYTFKNFEMVDIKSFVTKYFDNWQSQNISKFRIDKATQSSLSIYLEDLPYKYFPISCNNSNSLIININCTYQYEAPLPKNSIVGNLTLRIAEKDICLLNIYSSASIYKKGIGNYLLTFIKNYTFYLENIL